MRIALIIPGGVDRSGEYRVVPALLALIRRLVIQHEVHVFALHQEAQRADWNLGGAQVHNIGVRHTYRRALRLIGTKHRAAPFDVAHAIWSGPCGLIAVAAGKMLKIPSLIHVAGGELVALPEIGYGDSLRWRGRLREKVVLRGASAVTAASAPVIAMISRLGVSAQRVPLGVDLLTWPSRQPIRRRPGAPARLVHVASLNRVKDQATLLRALATLAEAGCAFEMDIVGEDTLRGEIQALTRDLGLSERVRFRGFLPQRQLRAVIEKTDLLMMSSRHEAGPLVVLEAAVAGVPTVGTAVGHIAELAPEAAFAVPVGDWAGLAREAGKVLGDEDLRMRIAGEALARAMREDAAYTARTFQACYVRLIASSSR